MSGKHHEFGAGGIPVGAPSNRSFGLVFAAAFTLWAGYLAYHGKVSFLPVACFAAFFGVTGACNAKLLTPLNRMWMKLGHLLGLIVAPIALGVLFFIVISPLAAMARAIGKDFLHIKRDVTRSSYWIVRQPPGPDAASMHQQF